MRVLCDGCIAISKVVVDGGVRNHNPDASNVSVSSSRCVLMRGSGVGYGSSGFYLGTNHSDSNLQIGHPYHCIIVHSYVTKRKSKLFAYNDRASNNVGGVITCGVANVNAGCKLHFGDAYRHNNMVRSVCLYGVRVVKMHSPFIISLG